MPKQVVSRSARPKRGPLMWKIKSLLKRRALARRSVPRGPRVIGIGMTMSVKLRYSISNTVSGATPIQQLWNLNSAFDPAGAQGTSQPVGYDQYGAFFNRVRVTACSCKFQYTNAAAVPVFITLLPRTSNASATHVQALQQQYVKSAVCGTIAGGNQSRALSHYISVARLTGDDFMNTVYSHAIGGDPDSLLYWQFIMTSTDGSTALSGTLVVSYVMHLTFYDRINLNDA